MKRGLHNTFNFDSFIYCNLFQRLFKQRMLYEISNQDQNENQKP